MSRYLLIAAAALAGAAAVAYFANQIPLTGPLLIASFLCLAFGVRAYPALRGFSYTIMIFAAVTIAMYYPQYIAQVGEFDTSKLIVPLLQVIMFGMGTALSIQDFARVASMPKGILVGILCQFSIMPIVGYSLTRVFSFPPEIAAGVILVGSCPSGLASNVMAFLARANLALSVSLTAVATLMAPLMTPFLMEQLAGSYVPVDFWKMLNDILKMVIYPVIGGLAFHHLFHGKAKWLDDAMPLVSMAGIALIITIITAKGRNDLLTIGPLLMLACLMHNLTGYFLGYWGGRLFRMPERDCRTIALEVGLQNGGLASGLAKGMGMLATVGLAPAIFGPLMNITGSSLATWWRSKPLPEGEAAEA